MGTIVSDNPLVAIIHCRLKVNRMIRGKSYAHNLFSEKNFVVFLRNAYHWRLL